MIMAGELPTTKIYEDDQVIAILDINPIQVGHTLVIPKNLSEDARVASEEDMAAVMNVGQKVACALTTSLNCAGVNFLLSCGAAAGQEVFHTHLHIIPRYENDGVTFPNEFGAYSSDEEKDEVGESIRSAL